MDDATPEESKPKGIKPANLTAIIIAAVAVALSGIGGGCLCSMVLRPVERLVFSPKER